MPANVQSVFDKNNSLIENMQTNNHNTSSGMMPYNKKSYTPTNFSIHKFISSQTDKPINSKQLTFLPSHKLKN